MKMRSTLLVILPALVAVSNAPADALPAGM